MCCDTVDRTPRRLYIAHSTEITGRYTTSYSVAISLRQNNYVYGRYSTIPEDQLFSDFHYVYVSCVLHLEVIITRLFHIGPYQASASITRGEAEGR